MPTKKKGAINIRGKRTAAQARAEKKREAEFRARHEALHALLTPKTPLLIRMFDCTMLPLATASEIVAKPGGGLGVRYYT